MPAMERLTPEIDSKTLRRFAKNLEEERQIANVIRCKYMPELNQNLLLSLNGATSKGSGYKDGFPDEGVILEELRERLIKVSTSGSKEQSVILGFFYTNLDPFLKKYQKIVVGIFPLYANKVQYVIRPEIYIDDSRNYTATRSNPKIVIREESFTGGDPFLATNPKGKQDFLFFKQSPFEKDNPYRMTLQKDMEYNWHHGEIEIQDLALEESIIQHSLRIAKEGKSPRLFKQTGFRTFIKNHCSSLKYIDLYTAYTQLPQKKH
jgi:hypothetical protein